MISLVDPPAVFHSDVVAVASPVDPATLPPIPPSPSAEIREAALAMIKQGENFQSIPPSELDNHVERCACRIAFFRSGPGMLLSRIDRLTSELGSVFASSMRTITKPGPLLMS